MKRRTFVAGGAVLLLGMGVAARRAVNPAPDLPGLMAELRQLAPQQLSSRGPWSVAQVFAHLAQSVEYSLRGYPELKPHWFRRTIGPAAYFAFETAGAMRHNLTEPIPGAPALVADENVAAAHARLLLALTEFEQWHGPLQPHFAYGVLDKSQYLQAHIMHVRNHLQELGSVDVSVTTAFDAIRAQHKE